MLFANESDDYNTLYSFFWSVCIFYNKKDLTGMGNRKRSRRWRIFTERFIFDQLGLLQKDIEIVTKKNKN